MHLFLWEYSCICGNTFKLPDLNAYAYGEFLLHNYRNESRYLCAIGDPVFAEVSRLVDSNVHTKDFKDYDRATILHSIFGLACDKASDGSTFKGGCQRSCSSCGVQLEGGRRTVPFEVVEMDIPETTYNGWHSLSEEEKERLIDNAINEELNNMDSEINKKRSLRRTWQLNNDNK